MEAPGECRVHEEEPTAQQAEPDLVALHNAYAALSQQLAQLDAKKQAGQWARLYRQVQAAEARVRQAEQKLPPSPAQPPECAKQQPECAKQAEAHSSDEDAALPLAEITAADERQAQQLTMASDLLYWKGGLKVLRKAQLPQWRGYFRWKIEAKIEALQTAYARLRAEAAKPDG